MDELQIDETFCGAICQHPSCWDSQKRCLRGLPRKTCMTPSTDSDSDEEGLPTQKVVNLLEDYGDDPRDKFPLRFAGRPAHERTNTSMQLGRSETRESYPRVRAPNATPSSMLRASAGKIGGSRSAPAAQSPPSLKTVEVQEVFDLDDLQSAWNTTFKTKSYYVWVPNPDRKTKLDPIQKVQIKRRQEGPDTVTLKDKTEEMVPREVEWEREATKMLMEVWPVLRKRTRTYASPRLDLVHPYPKTPRAARRENYYGDLLDRGKFAEALVKAIPKLEKRSKSLALANSEVLKQRKMKLLDGSSRTQQLHDIPQQVYMLDGESLDKVSIANEPTGQMEDEDQTVDPERYLPQNQLNKKKPLPNIAKEGSKPKVNFISLGLPEIPSGVQTTRPFNYKKKDYDFTLGRLPTPPPVTHRSESPRSTDQGSTLHVTMPSMPSDDMASAIKDWRREEEEDIDRLELILALLNSHPQVLAL